MSRQSVLTSRQPRASYKRKVLEKDVLRACLGLLRAKKIWCERRNSGVMESASGKGRWVKFGEKGMADIFALLDISVIDQHGQAWSTKPAAKIPLWIECKSSDGKQSYDQQLFQHIVEAEGHSYLLVRDVDELAAWLKARGL